MTERTFIAADAHSDVDLMAKLLKSAGVLDENLDRVEGWRTVQIGDFCNCVAESIDDGILVSHAGLTPDWGFSTADEALEEIEARWRRDPAWDEMFARIGYSRGGSGRYGGLLWSDWDEPKLATVKQIVGHTTGDDVRWRNDFSPNTTGWCSAWSACCIDVRGHRGGKLAGAIVTDGSVDIVTVEEDDAAIA